MVGVKKMRPGWDMDNWIVSMTGTVFGEQLI